MPIPFLRNTKEMAFRICEPAQLPGRHHITLAAAKAFRSRLAVSINGALLNPFSCSLRLTSSVFQTGMLYRCHFSSGIRTDAVHQWPKWRRISSWQRLFAAHIIVMGCTKAGVYPHFLWVEQNCQLFGILECICFVLMASNRLSARETTNAMAATEYITLN